MNKTEKYIKIIISLFGSVYLLSYFGIAIIRMFYPYELEWMEGGTVEHIIRILAGKDIYVKPSLDFIPYIYTPLYFWVGALFSKIFGVGFFSLRLLSFISSLVCMLFIYLFVEKETKNKFSAFVTMTLFPATFQIGGAWFDLARVDSMFMAFLLIAVYILRFYKSPKWYIIGGLIAFLSFFTKQSVLLVFCFIGLFLIFENFKRSLYFILSFAFFAISSTIVYTIISDGWYYFWNFSLVADHRWNNQFLWLFWANDLLKPLSVAIGFLLAFAIIKYYRREIKQQLFMIGFILGMIACAWLSRLHYGGFDNVLIPAYTAIILLFGISFDEILKLIKDENDYKSIIIRSLILLMIVAQFTTLYFNPRRMIPHNYDYSEGRQFIDHVSKVKGDVFIATNCYISRLSGKKSYAHIMLIFDLMQSHSKYGDSIRIEFNNALAEGKFAEFYINDWVIVNYPLISQYYENTGRVFKHYSALYSLTGFITRPEYIYKPRKKSV